MPGLANATHVCDIARASRGRTVWALTLAVVVGTIATFLFLIAMAYGQGAYNYGGYIFSGGARVPFDNIVMKMRNLLGPDWERLAYLCIGGVAMALLTALHYRFSWWPFHPIGFAAAPAYPVGQIAFPIFVAWIAKTSILHIGGAKMFDRAKPFFYGLILGYYTLAGVSFLIDMVWFPDQGHSLSLY